MSGGRCPTCGNTELELQILQVDAARTGLVRFCMLCKLKYPSPEPWRPEWGWDGSSPVPQRTYGSDAPPTPRGVSELV
eukprot:g14717.t1